MKQIEGTLSYFGPLITESSKIKREAVKRRKLYDEQAISKDQIPTFEAEGWEFDKSLKVLVRMRRQKSVDERLENRFWLLLAKLGYPEISDGRQFTVVIERKGAEPLRKQVDVFAQDEETVVVAECKASNKLNQAKSTKGRRRVCKFKGPDC